MSASQAGEKVQGWEWFTPLLSDSLCWEIDRKGHFAVVDSAPVLDRLEYSSEVSLTADYLYRVWLTLGCCADLHDCSEALPRVKCID